MFTNRSPRIASRLFVAAFLLIGSARIASAGRIGGALHDADTVRPSQAIVYTMRFKAGETARVGAEGNGDIDIAVYDENDRLVVQDDDDDNIPLCSWTPKWTGVFKVKVKNTTSRSIDYDFYTN